MIELLLFFQLEEKATGDCYFQQEEAISLNFQVN